MAATTRVHRRHQLEARRIADVGVGARDHHLAGFQRLSQAVQRLGAKLRQFVQKQHAVVRQADLAGLGLVTAARKRGHAGGMVRATERSGTGELASGDQAGHRMDHRGLQQLLRRQRRQQAGQPRRHHRLSGAGRADEAEVVPPGGGNLQRPLGILLALHVAKIRHALAVQKGPGLRRRQGLGAAKMVDQSDQRWCRQDPRVASPGRLGPTGLGTDQPQSQGPRRHRRRQRTGDRRDPPVQRQLANRRPVLQHVRRDDPHRRHDRQRDGQVVVTAFLGQVGRGQIGDDPLGRQRQTHAHEGRPHPLTALRHRLVAHADQKEFGLAARELDLHVDPHRFNATEGQGHHARRHTSTPCIQA